MWKNKVIFLIIILFIPKNIIIVANPVTNYKTIKIDLENLYGNMHQYHWSPDNNKIIINTFDYIVDCRGNVTTIEEINSNNVKWISNDELLINCNTYFKVYNIYNKSSKIYYLFDENNNQIVDCIFDFDYDSNHRNIVFTGNEINSSDQMSSELFIYNIGSGNVKKIVDDEHNDIYSTFFNNSGENVYYLQESWYSKFYHQLNVINLMTMELQGISENVNILRICKNSNIAYGRKMEFYRERDFPYRIEYKDIYLDMNNNTIQYYTDEEEVCIDGYKVPVKKGFLEKENVFIYLSPDKTKAIYLKEGEFIKLILF